MSSFYEILFAPPPIDIPTDFTVTDDGNGRVRFDLVHATQSTVRYSYIEVVYGDGSDFTDCIILTLPEGYTTTSLTGVPSGTQVSARAYSADTWGNVSLFTGIETVTIAAYGSGTMLVPLVTGDDTFVWLDGDLVWIEGTP